MEDNNIQKKLRLKNINIKLIIIVILVFIVLLGGTFAYYAYDGTNTNFNGNMGKVDLNLTVTKVLPSTDGVDDILVLNTSELASSLNNGCIDEEGDFALCQLYRVRLVNRSGSVNTDVKGSIKFNNQNTPNLSWLLLGNSYSSSTDYTSAMIGNNFITSTSTFVPFVDEYLLYSGSTIDYYILVWINETVEPQDDMGTYSGTIKFEDSNGQGVTVEFGD